MLLHLLIYDNMKNIFIILFYCFTSYSQVNETIISFTKDTIKLNKQISFYNKIDSTLLYKPNFNFKFNSSELNNFSIYNRNTKLNDFYLLSKDTLYYKKSIYINSNQYIRKDSFNPNGASNFGSGLIIGTLNTVFKSLF